MSNSIFDIISDSGLVPTPQIVKKLAESVNKSITDEEIPGIISRYQDHYIKEIQLTYGFSTNTMIGIHKEFEEVAASMLESISKDEKFKDQYEFYKDYLKKYPNLYMSIVPKQVLDSRIAARCIKENKHLKEQLAEMGKSLGHVVNQFSTLQELTGLPPLVKVLFSSIPSPLESSKAFESNNSSIDAYNSIYTYLISVRHNTDGEESLNALLTDPINYINTMMDPSILGQLNISKAQIQGLFDMIKKERSNMN